MNMVLLNLGVELVLEGPHLVIEYDFKQIHLLSYHNLVRVESIPVTDIVLRPQFWHHHAEQIAMIQSTHVG